MARYLNVVYLLMLVALMVLGFVWDAPGGVKALVGAAVLAPVALAILAIERRRTGQSTNPG
jgi:F0F1-type ATP synthase assembly protein I